MRRMDEKVRRIREWKEENVSTQHRLSAPNALNLFLADIEFLIWPLKFDIVPPGRLQ